MVSGKLMFALFLTNQPAERRILKANKKRKFSVFRLRPKGRDSSWFAVIEDFYVFFSTSRGLRPFFSFCYSAKVCGSQAATFRNAEIGRGDSSLVPGNTFGA
jgi:hypothetical protein